MTTLIRELGIDRLTIEERLTLAQDIWDGVEVEIDQQAISPAQRAELERRIQQANAHPEQGIPWEIVKAEALARSRR